MNDAGDASHCVLTKQSQRFYMGRKRDVLFSVQSVHLSLKSVDVNPEGAGGSPQGAFGYPNAMLAQLSTGWDRKKTIPKRYRLSLGICLISYIA